MDERAGAGGKPNQTWAKVGQGKLELVRGPIPNPGPSDAVVRTTLTTVCGSDLHFLHDYPMPRGADHLLMGHEGLGVVEALGDHVKGFAEGDRVVASCVFGCGSCTNCLAGQLHTCLTLGRIPGVSNALTGCQGDYFVVPYASVNLARVPDTVSDEQALLVPDILSTGFAAAERGGVGTGDSVAVFAQGPVGLGATGAARALGAGLVIAVEGVPERAEMARALGANVVIGPENAAERIRELTGGRGVDVAIEALGRQETFAAALEATRLDGTVSSVGIYATHRSLDVPIGLGFYQRRIVTTLCPGGGDRLRRLFAVAEHGTADWSQLITHRLPLSRTDEAYELFAARRDGVIKIALVPDDDWDEL
ncbi:MAG: zinc-binding dehydrogenase [Pseudonocardia sp.]